MTDVTWLACMPTLRLGAAAAAYVKALPVKCLMRCEACGRIRLLTHAIKYGCRAARTTMAQNARRPAAG
jgi:hypothetical protein